MKAPFGVLFFGPDLYRTIRVFALVGLHCFDAMKKTKTGKEIRDDGVRKEKISAAECVLLWRKADFDAKNE